MRITWWGMVPRVLHGIVVQRLVDVIHMVWGGHVGVEDYGVGFWWRGGIRRVEVH